MNLYDLTINSTQPIFEFVPLLENLVLHVDRPDIEMGFSIKMAELVYSRCERKNKIRTEYVGREAGCQHPIRTLSLYHHSLGFLQIKLNACPLKNFSKKCIGPQHSKEITSLSFQQQEMPLSFSQILDCGFVNTLIIF